MKKWIYLVIFATLLVILACQLTNNGKQKERVFEGDDFAFTIPAGWETAEKVWGKPMPEDRDYYGLGVIEKITIQYPPIKKMGKAFFSVAVGELEPGEALESRVKRAYEDPVTEMKDLTIQEVTIHEKSAYEAIYRRPWGEPWWKFRDVWVEQSNMVFVLSYHSAPETFSDYIEISDKIIDSFELR